MKPKRKNRTPLRAGALQVCALVVLTIVAAGLEAAGQANSPTPVLRVREQPGSPMRVSGFSCQPSVLDSSNTRRIPCQATITNVSDKKVITLGLAMRWLDLSNKPMGRHTAVVSYMFPGALPDGNGLSPSQKSEERIPGSRDATRGEISLAFVEFEDGTVWGDSESPHLAEIRAQRDGARQLILRLRQTIKAKGLTTALREAGIID